MYHIILCFRPITRESGIVILTIAIRSLNALKAFTKESIDTY